MVGKSPKAGIDLSVNERPAVEGLKRLSREFATTAVSINQSMEIAGKVFGAVQAAVGSVVGAMGDAVRAAMEVERVERRAFAAMQSRAGMSREEFDALSALNDARERQLNIDADEQLQLQGTLAALGVRKEALNAATEATIGLAEVTGQGLAEAGKKVAQVLGGNVNALKELGISASSAADAQRQLQEFFVLAEAQADTLETRVAALGHAYGSLQETLGGAVTQSTAAREIMDALTTAVGEFTTYLASEEGRRAVDQFFRYFALGAAMAIDSIEDLRVGAIDTINWFKKNFTDEVVVESLDPEPSTLRKLSARLFAIYQGAAELAPPIDASAMLTGAPRTATSVAGGGARGRSGEPASRTIDVGDLFTRTAAEQAELERATEARFAAERARWQADLQREVFESKIGTMRSQFEQEMALRQELHDRGMEWSAGANAQELQATLDQSNAMRQMVQQGAEMVSSGLSSMIANMVSGSMSAEEAFKGFVGSLITNLGTMLLNVGTAAVVLGGLSLIPGLQFITGGPGIGIGAGAAAMVAGAGLIAVGAAMGGGSGASTRAPAPGRGAGGGSMPRAPSSSMGDVVPRGFQGVMAGAVAPYTVNISFSGVVGDERRAARMIEDVLRRGR